MWNYTNAVHEHFLRPHNAGPMEDANAIGEVGWPVATPSSSI